jgi:hypothetical protein
MRNLRGRKLKKSQIQLIHFIIPLCHSKPMCAGLNVGEKEENDGNLKIILNNHWQEMDDG